MAEAGDRRRAGVSGVAVLAVRGRLSDDRAPTSPGRCSCRPPPCTRCSAGWSATATSRAAPDAAIEFTDSGREHAERVVGRHRMIERFLTDVVGVPWDDVHEEAEQLEHAMTPRFEAYVRAAVGDADDLPARPPDQGRRADRRRAAGRLRGRRHGHDPAPGERGRGPAALPQGGSASSPGPRARSRPTTARRSSLTCEDTASSVTFSVAETVSVLADPVAAAAHRAARAARARPRALRPLARADAPARQLAPGGQPAPDLGVDGGVVEQVEVVAPPRWLYWSTGNSQPLAAAVV